MKVSEVEKKTDKKLKLEYSARENKVFFGNNDEVNRVGFSDYAEMSQWSGRKQSMKGFDPQYIDFVDYIVKITHNIWEEKGIGIIYDTYHNGVKVHFGSVNIHGVNEVVSGTLQTLHAFPDRRLVAENVIWSGNDEEGFYSSHRIISSATNLGDSSFGPATGKRSVFRTVAECFVYANRIVEEWLVRDNLYIVKQLGLDPVMVAKEMARKSKSNTTAFQEQFGLGESVEGQCSPKTFTKKTGSFDIGDFILEMYNKIWEWKLINHVKDFYAENATTNFICDQQLVGHTQIQGMFISLFASFPTARLVIDRVNCNQGGLQNEWDVAVRWRLQGIHGGFGYFGTPSGAPVEILGVTHFRVLNEKIVEEWITFDGLDVLKQIFLYKDDASISGSLVTAENESDEEEAEE